MHMSYVKKHDKSESDTSLKVALAQLDHLIDFDDPIISCNDVFSIKRLHPFFADRYRKILDRPRFCRIFDNIKSLLRLFLSILRALLSLRLSICDQRILKNQPNPKIIIFSHILNDEQSMPGADQYFGFLIKFLEKEHFSHLVLYIDHTKSNRFTKKLSDNCYVIGKNLGFIYEARIGQKLMEFLLARKKMIIESQENRAVKHLSRIMNSYTLSSTTINNLRFLLFGEFLFKKFKPDYVFTTNEGHAWEQMVRFAAKSAHRDVKCVGFIHSFPFSDRLDIFETPLNQYRNDAVGFTGSSAIQIYESHQSTADGSVPHRLFVLGANRYKPVVAGPQHQILCIPEGLDSEVDVMFDFILRCATFWPKFEFVFRVHPVISYRDCLARRIDSLALENLTISSCSLDQDLSNSGVVLYRGSTAVFRAISSGLLPVYVSIGDELDIDVLDALSFGHPKVNHPAGLHASVCHAEQNFDFEGAREFVDNLWSELNADWFKGL